MQLKPRWSEDRYDSEDVNDTSLRFTDVLFGFALREVVLRLVRWDELTNAARVHLLLATITILGSYIGFRNSQKRGKFRLRFFNLATWRFLVDQAMVFLYFWLALYLPTDRDPTTGDLRLPSAHALLTFDARVVFGIFVLYVAWDSISHWMAHSGKYFDSVDKQLDAKAYRTVITVVGLLAVAVVLVVSVAVEPSESAATWWIGVLLAVVVLYRIAKDVLQEAK